MNNNDLISRSELLKKLNNMGGCGAEKNSWADGWDKAIDDVYKFVESEPRIPILAAIQNQTPNPTT